MRGWPDFTQRADEVLFDAVAEDVLHPLDSGAVVEHGTRRIALRPELALPAVYRAETPREVALEVLHEGCQLRCAGCGQEQVVVVAHEDVSVELDIEQSDGLGQDPNGDGVDLGRRT